MPASSHIRRADRPQLPTNEPADGWVPPEETVWQRYSPNGESVIAGMTSLLLHVALVGIILAGVWAWFDRREIAAEPMELVTDGTNEGSGQGNENTNGLKAGAPPEKSDVQKPLNPDTKPPNEVVPKQDINVQAPRPPAKTDPTGDALSKKFNGRPELANLGTKLRELMGVFNGPGVRGKSKSDTGQGSVKGDTIGNKPGQFGDGPKSKTWDRMQRWELVFNTNNARHYLDQLDALGAIVAMIDQNDNLAAVRNLKERPAQLEIRDLTSLNRMFWVDDRPDSVESVARDLGLNFVPAAIVAFFPKSLEAELLAKELAYQGLAEKDIQTTKFSITFRGGKHVIRVMEQQPQKKGKK